MTDLQKVSRWVMTYPGWGKDEKLTIAYADAVPNHAGLYPTGVKQIAMHQDLLGNVTARYRYSFVIYRVVGMQTKQEENAQWLIDFQRWVYQQNYSGTVPQLGEGRTCLRAENGRLYKTSQAGTATFAVDLIAEFDASYKAQ